MVDFNNETTVTRPATDIVRVLVLQRRNDAIDGLGFHKKRELSGIDQGVGMVQDRLFTLWLELQGGLKRRLAAEAYRELQRQVLSNKYEDLLEAFLFMNEELDRLKLTRIDTGQVYDSTRVEEENKAKHL